MPWFHGLRKPGTNSKKRLIIAKINLSRKVPNISEISVKKLLEKTSYPESVVRKFYRKTHVR